MPGGLNIFEKLSPSVAVTVFFVVVTVIFFVMSAIFVYHWRTFGVSARVMHRVEIIYFGVSGPIIIVAFISFLSLLAQ